VPNSRGAHGSKDYEGLEVDAVLCGCQVQSPGETASLLVEWWDLLAPRYEDASEALDASCQLLAQRAVSPTIQAAGRFRQQATTVLFERSDLVELAGFEHKEATADMDGFVGALERRFLWAKEEYQRRMQVLNCRRVVGHLEKSEENNPTERQCLSKYMRGFDATEEEAAEALKVALDEGVVEYVAEQRRFRLPEE
jgi:hypothetical protein